MLLPPTADLQGGAEIDQVGTGRSSFRDPLLALVPAAFSAPQGNFRISKATGKARLRFFAICSAGPADAWRSLRNRKAGQYNGQLQRISEQDPAQLTPGTECVITSASSSNHGTELRRKRLLFRCWHRGTQEIDLIFGTFAETALTGFSTEQLDRFEPCSTATTPTCSTGSPAAEHRR